MNTLAIIIFVMVQVSAITEPDKDSFFQYIQSNYDQGEISQVASLSYQDLQHYNLSGDTLTWSLVFISRARLYHREYESSFQLYKDRIQPLNLAENSLLGLDARSLEALLYKKMDEVYPAKSYLDSSRISYSRLINSIPDSLAGFKAGVYNNFGNVNWEMGYPEVYYSAQKMALKYAKIANDNDRISRAYRNLAEYYEKIEIDWDQAIELREKAEKYGKPGTKLETTLANSIRKAEQLRDAYQDYESAQKILYNAKNKAKMAGLIEIEGLANIALMRSKVQYSKYLKERKASRNYLILTIVILVIISATSWYHYFNPSKEKIREELFN
ncbi:hypothetical protein [Gracilimonas sediminicola]|uniref:hypothetical protein n=1 Tax=Gracilimonas sediminicola TaxID=2952158 RepID=UPI0038D3857C